MLPQKSLAFIEERNVLKDSKQRRAVVVIDKTNSYSVPCFAKKMMDALLRDAAAADGHVIDESLKPSIPGIKTKLIREIRRRLNN